MGTLETGSHLTKESLPLYSSTGTYPWLCTKACAGLRPPQSLFTSACHTCESPRWPFSPQTPASICSLSLATPDSLMCVRVRVRVRCVCLCMCVCAHASVFLQCLFLLCSLLSQTAPAMASWLLLFSLLWTRPDVPGCFLSLFSTIKALLYQSGRVSEFFTVPTPVHTLPKQLAFSALLFSTIRSLRNYKKLF